MISDLLRQLLYANLRKKYYASRGSTEYVSLYDRAIRIRYDDLCDLGYQDLAIQAITGSSRIAKE